MKGIPKFKAFLFEPIFIIIATGLVYISKLLPINPFYFGLLLAIFLYIGIILTKPTLPVVRIPVGCDRFLILVHFMLFCHILINSYINQVILKDPILLILSICFFYFPLRLSKLKQDSITKFLSIFRFIIISVIAFECFYRLLHPVYFLGPNRTSPVEGFYIYKFSSVMFADSNQVGVLISCFFSLLLYFNEKKILYTNKIILGIVFLFLILTFSRAALLGSCCFLIYWYIFRKLSYMNRGFIIIALCIPAVFLINYCLSDESFKTKLFIYNKTYEWLKDTNTFNLLIGVGMQNSIKALSFYAHNYFSLFLVEYGLIGLILFLMQIVIMIVLSKGTLFIIIPYLVLGLSYIPYFSPYLYLCLGIIFSFDYYSKNNRSKNFNLLSNR